VNLLGEWKLTLPSGESLLWQPDDMLGSELLMVEQELQNTKWAETARWAGDDLMAAMLAGVKAARHEPCQVLVWFLRRKAGQQLERISVNEQWRRMRVEEVEAPEDEAATPPPETSTSSPASGDSESEPTTGTT
jgi:hypothetical protein